jgi:uncharacterized protein (DUF952 family)
VIVFHIAERARWEAAKLAGSYAQSTYGRTLDEEGFIHAAREDQWPAVRERYYADVAEPLVLLAIDTDRLTAPWREDQVGAETYPHIYGPLNPSAVLTAVPLDATPASAPSPTRPVAADDSTTSAAAPPARSFLSLFLGEFAFRVAWATAAMALAVLLGSLTNSVLGEPWGLVGALVGLVVGFVAGRPFARRRDARLAPDLHE